MDSKLKIKNRDIALIPLFSALMAVCAWISIPSPIPFTMQTFAVFFALSFLGAAKGMVSIGIYLLMGAIGLPVYASFTSGMGILLGMNGGYMFGWLFSGLAMLIFEKLFCEKIWIRAISMVAGLALCYVTGTAWFMAVYAAETGTVGLWAAIAFCVAPFVIPDLIKLGLVLWISQRLKKVSF